MKCACRLRLFFPLVDLHFCSSSCSFQSRPKTKPGFVLFHIYPSPTRPDHRNRPRTLHQEKKKRRRKIKTSLPRVSFFSCYLFLFLLNRFRHFHTPTSPINPNLVVGNAALGELENDVTAGQSSVDLTVGIQAVVNTTTLLLVKDDLEDLAAVLLGADALADDLNGVDKVGQDGVVHGSESARARTLLGELGARAGRALGTGQNAARSNEEDLAVGELLLELTGQAGKVYVSSDGLPEYAFF